MQYKKIGVMCGSSDACPQEYLDLAYQVGQELGKNNLEIVYGGGAKGLMRNVADGGLEAGTQVHGYMPQFMIAVEWQHTSLSQLHITQDMAERKYKMMSESDATIFLPGGCGTMEEFFEWLSAKRLGKYTGPLVIFNFQDYYKPLIDLLKNMEINKFHNQIHAKMYSVCSDVSQLVETMKKAPEWSEDAIKHAAVE